MKPQETHNKKHQSTLVKLIATRVQNGWLIGKQYADETVEETVLLGADYDNLLGELSFRISTPPDTPPTQTEEGVEDL